MNLKQLLTVSALLLTAACTQSPSGGVTRYVDPKIGTGGHGHVFVGANVPFGMVQVGPTSIPQQWDWCSGYHESDSTVIGFSHTHLSGTGIGDLFDITVMPVVGEVTYARGTEDDPASGLWSYADRTHEVARPGYYAVPLTRYGITAEMTATARVGFHRYTFPASDAAAVVFDLENGGCWDKATETHIEAVGDRRIDGVGNAGERQCAVFVLQPLNSRNRIVFGGGFRQSEQLQNFVHRKLFCGLRMFARRVVGLRIGLFEQRQQGVLLAFGKGQQFVVAV